MSYYMGDYYAGDYRGGRGDPGFWSALKKIGGAAIGMIPGLGPASKVVGIVPKMPGGARAIEVLSRAKQGILKHPVLSGAAAAGAIGAMGAARGSHRMIAGPGGAGGGFARRRRMNVCNPRALRRAIRRSQGFAKLAKRVLRFTSPRPPRGHAFFKSKRRARRV
jgi:hypothetical protein